MGMIIHKTFGAGEIIDRDDKNSITVRFGNGKELRFAIPESFEKGFITAYGDLKEEVERIIAKRKALLSAEPKSSESKSSSAVKSKRIQSNLEITLTDELTEALAKEISGENE